MNNLLGISKVHSVLVTGADGFIGSTLVDYLVSHDIYVKCLVHHKEKIQWLAENNCKVEIIIGDILNPHTLINAVEGVDFVFHLAGVVKSLKNKDFLDVNVKGTENLIQEIINKNPCIKRFLYLSSQSASGPSNCHRLVNESDTPLPVSDYGYSKLKAEEVVLSYQDKIPVTIIRPSAVYGPRDKEFLGIFSIINKGIKPFILCKNRYLNFCYIDDLVKAMVLAVADEKSIGQTYFIHSDQKISTNQFLEEIVHSFNKKVFTIPVPLLFIKFYFLFNEVYCRIKGDAKIFAHDKYRDFRQCYWLSSIDKAKEEIGYEPDYIVSEGISRSIEWYKKQGWL